MTYHYSPVPCIDWVIPFFIQTGVWTKILKTSMLWKNNCLTRKLLKFNLRQFNLLEKNDTLKQISVFHPKKGNCANLLPGKIYLEIETSGKNHNQEILCIFASIHLCR